MKRFYSKAGSMTMSLCALKQAWQALIAPGGAKRGAIRWITASDRPHRQRGDARRIYQIHSIACCRAAARTVILRPRQQRSAVWRRRRAYMQESLTIPLAAVQQMQGCQLGADGK